jgi:hypothetical protein
VSSKARPIFDDAFSERLAQLLDRWIRIGPFSVGLDGLLGLIPGIGDVTSGAFSALIVFRAIQHGVPRAAVLRMLVNVAIDTLIGSVPLIGDFFDFAFKANLKNLEIYQASLNGARDNRRDWAFIIFVALALAALLALPLLWITLLSALLSTFLTSLLQSLIGAL